MKRGMAGGAVLARWCQNLAVPAAVLGLVSEAAGAENTDDLGEVRR
jgi:hypothetical protein